MRPPAAAVFCLAAAAGLAAAGEGEAKVDGPVIGIDLGTTYSCVAIYKNGQVEVIPNELGNRITPSVVAFASGGERLVGEAAKHQAAANPARTFRDVKRVIGRASLEEYEKARRDALPFRTVRSEGGDLRLVTGEGDEPPYRPEQISAMVLSKMKDIAETYLGTEVRHAVVTVPASFNSAQRQATKDAAALAGLTALRLLSEPTAAAVAYGLDKQTARTVLVYDLGGGTFDVSVLKIENGVFEVLATAGDPWLGGADFDRTVAQHWMQALEKQHGKRPAAEKASVMQKLLREAEKAKRTLSSVPQARFSVEGLGEGAAFSGTLTRARFEELNQDLFRRTLSLTERALKDAGLARSGVDDVVLVGGSTRIPKVQQLVREFFDGKELTRGINPDEAVAYGAAVQAGSMSSWSGGVALVLLDVTPLTLGIETVGGVMTQLIGRNTPLPARNATVFTTHRDGQPALDIKVFEGERLLTRNNHFLGKFRLGGIAPAPRGQSQVEVTFNVDEDGILTVIAEDKGGGRNETLTVSGGGGRLSPAEIEAMIKEAEEFAEEDRQAKERADARVGLEVYLASVKGLLEGEAGPLPAERERLQTALLDGKDWLASNPDAGAEEVGEKLAEVQGLCGGLAAQRSGGAAPGGAPVDDDMEGHDEL